MLFFCEWTRGVWFGLQFQRVPNRDFVSSFHAWLGTTFSELDGMKEYKEFAKISICCALWSIWKGRNAAIFESKTPNPMEVLIKTTYLQNEYYQHWLNSTRSTEPQGQPFQASKVWRPPSLGATKLNSDAAYDDKKKMAWTGTVVRNENGELVAGLTKVFPATSSLIAEALGFRESLAFAHSLGMTNIIVENDNLELIQACREDINRGEIRSITNDVVALKRNFQKAGFTWTPREGNGAAHLVAKMASRKQLPSNWVWNVPTNLRLQIDKDKLLLSTTGFPFDPGRLPPPADNRDQ